MPVMPSLLPSGFLQLIRIINLQSCLAGKDLSFVFTNVDPNDHARQFTFGVTVQEGQTYAGMAWSVCLA